MSTLTLAFSNRSPKPRPSEPPRFGSPNRPGLAIVSPALQSAETKTLRLFSAYLQRERRVSEHTVINYLNHVRQFEQWLELNGRGEAGCCLEQAGRDDVQAYIVRRMAEGLSANSAQAKLIALRTFYRLLLDEELITDNPTRGVPVPKKQQTLPKCLSADDIERVVRWMETANDKHGRCFPLRDRAIMLTLFASALRASELIHLKLADVDLENGFIKVWNGKGGKDGIVPLSPPAIEALISYIHDVRPKHDPEQNCPYVFLSYHRGPLSRQALYIRLREIGRQALGRDVSPHQFRHACATALLKGGADIRDVQAVLRHADIDTTQIYLHVDTTFLRGIYDKSHPRA